ncbi:hypothetical protein [Halomarina oriensis]|uniref:Uncharacterized protein n=1 Tax=Halomarina oriensis TaxID=671145 RepID=A0A6B0GP71_9EURY|nr:hypothetical protein [Halomarina oriensis]MWG36612.1 hypothetical protein [Halomarina oriensis]
MATDDVGMVAEAGWNDYLENTFSNCVNETTVQSSMYMKAGVASEPFESYAHDEVTPGGNLPWKFFCHFKERPDSQLYPRCDASDVGVGGYDVRPRPASYRFEVGTYTGEEPRGFIYQQPSPDDGDGDSDNPLTGPNLILDLLSVAGPYAGLTSAIAKYLIAGSGSSGADVVDNADKDNWTFDVPLTGGYNDLPREGYFDGDQRAGVAMASLRVDNGYDPGPENHTGTFMPQYTFKYAQSTDGGTFCQCDDYHWEYHTTMPGIPLFPYYEVVERA